MTAGSASKPKVWSAEPEQLRRIFSPSLLTASMQKVDETNQVSNRRAMRVTRTLFSKRRPTVFHAELGVSGRDVGLGYILEYAGNQTHSHCEAERKRLAKSRRAQIGKDDQHSVFEMADLGLVARRPGLDAKLPGLGLIAHEDELVDLCARALNVGTQGLSARARLRTHRLGKRAVIQIDVSGSHDRQLFVRLRPVASSSGRDAYERHKAIAESFSKLPHIALPAAILFDEDLGAAVYEGLEGELPDFGRGSSERDADALALALDSIASIQPDIGTRHTGSNELEIVRDWSARLAKLHPILSASLDPVVERLERELARDEDFVPCHRDLHEGQILVQSDRVGILDFDTFRLADPALDAGNAIAHLRLRSLRSGSSLINCEALLRQSALRRTNAQRLQIWIDAALVRLAGIYGHTSGGLRLASALLNETGR